MQCPSCRFENMPGSRLCARCRADLTTATRTFDVNPPRASGASKAVPMELKSVFYRWRFGLVRQWQQFRKGNLGNILTSSIRMPRIGFSRGTDGDGIITDAIDWPLLVVPGWVQWRHGERSRGAIIFGVYLVLASSLIWFAGLPFGAAAQGLMFAWHVLASIDAMQRRFDGFAQRIATTLAVAAVLGIVFYYPATLAVSRFAMPISINYTTGMFNSGEVLLVNQTSSPQAGSLVLYEINRQRFQNLPGYGNAIYQVQGQRIGRMVATGGQSLAFENGKLMVDGVLSPWQPSSPTPFNALVVPIGASFVLPDNLGINPLNIRPEVYAQLGVVSSRSIQGIVYWRTHPFSRFGAL